MTIINTATHDLTTLSNNETYWVYNGLDCCITEEIRKTLEKELTPITKETYETTLALQAPFLEMQLRGIRIDSHNHKQALDQTEKIKSTRITNFNRLCQEGVGTPFPINPLSHTQLKKLLYDVLGTPVIKKRNTNKILSPSSSEETLEELQKYFWAETFCKHILAIRSCTKALGFLKSKKDPDNRMRCKLNLAGTNTGRVSSSLNVFGSGTNLQNVDSTLRSIFVADPGKILINIDLEQADSRNLGALCWDFFVESHGEEFAGAYLNACESSDLHTQIAKAAYPSLAWGTAPDRAIADAVLHGTSSYRYLAKTLGHATNYLVTPKTAAKKSRLTTEQVELFQKNYFEKFPCIPAWHKETIKRLQATSQITHLFGRQRTFWDRLDSSSTIRAAIAYSPQGMTGEEINRGILNLWKDKRFELFLQVHDSILMQVDQNHVNQLVPLALELMKVTLTLKKGRKFTVPLEALTGWNWGYKSLINPYGLTKGRETRTPPKTFNKKQTIKKFL